MEKINIKKEEQHLDTNLVEIINIDSDEVCIKSEADSMMKLNNKKNNFVSSSIASRPSLTEPTPLNIQYYSCPASDEQIPCPIYESKQKVRQHIVFFHKISMEHQKQWGMSIPKHNFNSMSLP